MAIREHHPLHHPLLPPPQTNSSTPPPQTTNLTHTTHSPRDSPRPVPIIRISSPLAPSGTPTANKSHQPPIHGGPQAGTTPPAASSELVYPSPPPPPSQSASQLSVVASITVFCTLSNTPSVYHSRSAPWLAWRARAITAPRVAGAECAWVSSGVAASSGTPSSRVLSKSEGGRLQSME